MSFLRYCHLFHACHSVIQVSDYLVISAQQLSASNITIIRAAQAVTIILTDKKETAS